jgi:hypothetical protein
VALVIGNQKYRDENPLTTSVNDANDMALTLSRLGFRITCTLNLNYRDFRSQVDRFIDSVSESDTVLFYYAGHALVAEGTNYLLPVDFVRTEEDEVKNKAVAADLLLNRLRKKKPAVSILILDACRNNSFAAHRGGTTGLAEVSSARGEYIAFATAPGRTASDGGAGSGHGLFTKYLLAELAKPGLEIDEIFAAVRAGVDRESRGAQTPWSNTALLGKFYFDPSKRAQSDPVPPVPIRAPAPSPDCNGASPPKTEGQYATQARCELSNQQFSTAVRLANQAIAINSENASYYLLRAQAHRGLRNSDKARSDLEKAITLDGENAAAFFELGSMLRENGDFVAAERELREARRLAPTQSDICYALADVMENTGEAKQAAELKKQCGR